MAKPLTKEQAIRVLKVVNELGISLDQYTTEAILDYTEDWEAKFKFALENTPEG